MTGSDWSDVPAGVDLAAAGFWPDVVADTVLKAANATHPKIRYAAGKLANRLRLLRRFAPAAWWMPGFERTSGLMRSRRRSLPAPPEPKDMI